MLATIGTKVALNRLVRNRIHMMGYGMMGGAGVFGSITWLVIVVDLVLVGIWLWQHISKK